MISPRDYVWNCGGENPIIPAVYFYYPPFTFSAGDSKSKYM